MKEIERILVATDFSAGATAAAEVAARLARQLGAAVDVVTVINTAPLAEAYGDVGYRSQRMEEITLGARAEAERFAATHFSGVAHVSLHVRDGNAYLEIVQAAQDYGSDMIIVGTRGRTGLAHLLIGSVAERVVRGSPVPVLTVHS